MKSQHLIAGVVAGLFVTLMLPVLYVLSLGPANWLDMNYTIPDPWHRGLELFYSPLAFLAEQNPTIMSFLEWYQNLWMIVVFGSG